MEGVAHREAEREELHKEMAGVELRLLQRRQQLREVEQQQRQTSESARNEAQELTNRRRELFQQIEQVKIIERFSKINKKISNHYVCENKNLYCCLGFFVIQALWPETYKTNLIDLIAVLV